MGTTLWTETPCSPTTSPMARQRGCCPASFYFRLIAFKVVVLIVQLFKAKCLHLFLRLILILLSPKQPSHMLFLICCPPGTGSGPFRLQVGVLPAVCGVTGGGVHRHHVLPDFGGLGGQGPKDGPMVLESTRWCQPVGPGIQTIKTMVGLI